MGRLRFLVGSIITLTLGTSVSPLAFGQNDPLATFKAAKFPMPRGLCLYEDSDHDIKEATSQALDRLTAMADSNKSECKAVVNEAQNVQDSIKTYFESVYGREGIIKEKEEYFIVANCRNYDKVLQVQMAEYRKYIMLGGSLSDKNPFKGRCPQDNGKEFSTTGQISPSTEQCLRDNLVQDLRNYQNYCQTQQETPMNDLVYDLRQKVKTQEVAAYNLQKGMDTIFQNILSGKCFESKDMAKSILQSVITIGANVAGTAMGPGYGLGLGIAGQTLNFALDYIAKFADGQLTVRQLLKDKNFENASCMFVGLQKRYCEQLNIQPTAQLEKFSCAMRDRASQFPILELVDGYKRETHFEGQGEEGGPGPMPIYYRDMKKLLGSLENKRTLPFSKEEYELAERDLSKIASEGEKSLGDILKGTIEFYDSKNPKEMNRLLHVQDDLKEGRELVQLYESLDKDERGLSLPFLGTSSDKTPDKFSQKRSLLIRMGQLLKHIHDQDVSGLLENYLNAHTYGLEGLDKILAEEMSLEIMKGFQKKLQTFEGNLDSLRDVTDSAVEQFRPVFQERMDRRFFVNFQNAAIAEKDLLTSLKRQPANKTQVQGRRREVFAWLRDITKDCLMTQGVHFMKRETPGFFASLFGQPQVSAMLNIDRAPEFYLQACKAFMCEDGSGIPIPSLKNKNTAASDYQRYSCQFLNKQEDIFKSLRDNYIQKGTICGKTIQELTSFKLPPSSYISYGARLSPGMIRSADRAYQTSFEPQSQNIERISRIIKGGK